MIAKAAIYHDSECLARKILIHVPSAFGTWPDVYMHDDDVNARKTCSAWTKLELLARGSHELLIFDCAKQRKKRRKIGAGYKLGAV